MCRTLFRFEDKYGMHTIVTSLRDIQENPYESLYKCSDIYIQYGLSCVPCLCIEDVRDLCSTLGISRAVLFFELDGPQGGVLTFEDVFERFTVLNGVEGLYYPVAWCAETILHYQLCTTLLDAEIYPVPKMVRKYLDNEYEINVKRTKEVLDIITLRKRLSELDLEKLLSRRIIEFLLELSETAYTIGELKPWMDLAKQKYEANLGWWKQEK